MIAEAVLIDSMTLTAAAMDSVYMVGRECESMGTCF